MKTTPTFTEALALITEYLQAERDDYENNIVGPWSSGDEQAPFHIFSLLHHLHG